LQAYRALLAPATKIMVMLKAFGYGSTDAELGRWLQHNGVDYLAVAYADEGMALREGGVRLPIMVMNPEPGAFEQIVTHRLEPEIFSFELLKAFEAFAAANGLHQYPIHLKLDTGMHRLGFLPHEADRLADALASLPCLQVASVFTHLVASENPEHDAFTRQQASLFEAAAGRLRQKLGYPLLMHAANTAAILRHKAMHYHMVRLGIGLFGAAAPQGLALQAATRLHTTVAQVKQVKAGESVGYGRHALLSRNSTIATVRIGYADGYRRALGNGVGAMWLHGQPVPVVGNVCMDMTMLDVTGLPQVQPGDRVEVFGDNISISALARLCNTIPYEIMTGISRRVKRVLVEE
jgi:alanine racemase